MNSANEKKIKISFIILCWNSKKFLKNCISSIDRSLEKTGYTYEMLVLDNGSIDGSSDFLKELAKSRPSMLHPYFEPNNTGTSRSRNFLFKKAVGDFLCVMDSDVELTEGVIETLIQKLKMDRLAGIVAPRIIYPTGAWQKSVDRFPTLINKAKRFFRLRSIEEAESKQKFLSKQSYYVDYAISAFWLMRRALLKNVGMFDERIFYSPEDVDFCLRARKLGFRVLYVPTVAVTHHTQEISRGFKVNAAKLHHIRGLIYYFFKHRYLLRRPSFD